ncbi:MAG: hypothetical protein IGS39_25330 [Calothrix sp. C42_A2020_038]|nr:hypothetical protein [Calothrix sp. C42_A2020_038]
MHKCIAFILYKPTDTDRFKGDEYEVVMLPLKPSGKAVTPRDFHVRLSQKLKSDNWLWLLGFVAISVCNGWFLRVTSASLILVIFFAVFPLVYTVYEVFDNTRFTKLLSLLMLILWCVIAFTIVDLDLPPISPVAIILYSINIIFFGFVLIDVLSDSGAFMLLFVTAIAILLFKITSWETVLRLIWFCNLMVTASNAGTRLNRFCLSFSAAMIVLTGAATLSLSLGWILGGV